VTNTTTACEAGWPTLHLIKLWLPHPSRFSKGGDHNARLSSMSSLPHRTVIQVLDLASGKSHADGVRSLRIATIFANLPRFRSSPGSQLKSGRLRAKDPRLAAKVLFF